MACMSGGQSIGQGNPFTSAPPPFSLPLDIPVGGWEALIGIIRRASQVCISVQEHQQKETATLHESGRHVAIIFLIGFKPDEAQ